MKKFLAGVLITLSVVLIVRSCQHNNKDASILQESSMLIQQEIINVSKLIVTEGHFSEVYTYKDSKELFGSLLTAEKKALVVVNADVTIAYDLRKINFDVNEATKTLRIKNIPEPEININPEFEYYDVSSDYLNQFDASDYNKININVRASLLNKVEASSLKSNAQNRLISELQKFYVLTNSLGWQLLYKDKMLENGTDLNQIKP